MAYPDAEVVQAFGHEVPQPSSVIAIIMLAPGPCSIVCVDFTPRRVLASSYR